MKHKHHRHHEHKHHKHHYKHPKYHHNNHKHHQEQSYEQTKKYATPSEKNKDSNKTLKIKLRFKILIGIIVLNIISFSIFSKFSEWIIAIDIVVVLLYLWGSSNSCPHCHRYWAKKLTGRDNFGTHTEYKTVNRTISHRDSQGNLIGTSSGNETKPVTMKTVQNHWQCKYCGYKWSGNVHDVKA